MLPGTGRGKMVCAWHEEPDELMLRADSLLHMCRVYRGNEPGHGVFLIAHGGCAEALDVHAYTMGSIWASRADLPAKQAEPALG